MADDGTPDWLKTATAVAPAAPSLPPPATPGGIGAPGGSPFFPTMGEEQYKGMQAGMEKALQEKTGAESALSGQFERNLERYHERVGREEAQQAHELGDMKKWDAESELRKRDVSLWEQFGSPAFVLSMLASAFSAKPMNSALLAGGVAMQSLKEGRMEDYQRAFDAWKANTDLSIKRFNMEHELHSEFAEDFTKDMESARLKASQAAERFGDKKLKVMLDNGYVKEYFEAIDGRSKALLEMSKAAEANTKANFAMRYVDSQLRESGIDLQHMGPQDVQKASALQMNAYQQFENMDKPKQLAFLKADAEHLVNNGKSMGAKEIQKWEHDWNADQLGAKGGIVEQEIRHNLAVSDAAAPPEEDELSRQRRHEQIISRAKQAAKGQAVGADQEQLEDAGWNNQSITNAAITYNRTGQLPKLGTTRSFSGPINSAIITKADDLLAADNKDSNDRSTDWLRYKAQGKAISAWLAPGPTSNRVSFLGTAVDHLDVLRRLADANAAGNKQRFNAIAQRWAIETGNAAPTNMETASQIVGTEIIKAISSSGPGTGAERLEQSHHFDRRGSSEQVYGAINTVEKLLGGQLNSLKRQFMAETKLPGTEFDGLIGPHGTDVLQRATAAVPSGPRKFKPGDIRNGYILEGEDDTDPKSWRKL
jgi:hypothetical protein